MALDPMQAFAFFGMFVVAASAVFIIGKASLYVASAVVEKAKRDIRSK